MTFPYTRPRIRWWRLLCAAFVLVPALALARVGGGENYTTPSSGNGGGDDDISGLVFFLIELLFRHPQIGIPLLIIVAIGYVVLQKSRDPGSRTQRAIQQAEAARRTQVSSSHVDGWVNALRREDPGFDLEALYGKVRTLFMDVQQAWFVRDLERVRPFLSDATFQRLTGQLDLLKRQGVRDAIADVRILEVGLIGLEQSEWFDTVHLRVRAQMRDTDVPATASDAQSHAAAQRVPVEAFTEVWSFVRKPGAKTKLGEDLYQGKCPHCGAPFNGGATNVCEYCKAVVNSGNYDWTLSEITQGVEHVPHNPKVEGLLEARTADPALNLETLEDRTSLIFWRWIAAQSHSEARELAKLATPTYVAALGAQFDALRKQNKRKVFLECAVGGVIVRALHPAQGEYDEAHVEIRWSARLGVVGLDQRPPQFPPLPQRWVFVLARKAGAVTRTDNGLSTNRCPQCNAPLSDSLSTTCDYCGTELAHGERDWVLREALSWDAWRGADTRRDHVPVPTKGARTSTDGVLDAGERERLLYVMAAVANADGAVDEKERALLRMCAQRWSVDWPKIESALNMGIDSASISVPRGSPEAESVLRAVVQMALVDGRVDRKERQMLASVAHHLGLEQRLDALIGR